MQSFKQFGRFLGVGIFNTLVGYGIYAALTLAGLSPSGALVLTYIIAVPMNYLTTGRLVFGTFTAKKLAEFIIAYIAIYFVNLGALQGLMKLGLSQLLSQAVAVPFMAILSFLVFKLCVFEKR